jgi:hypothetical protein
LCESQLRDQATDRMMQMENTGSQPLLNDQVQDVKRRVENADQSLSSHSFDHESAIAPGAVENSVEEHGTSTTGVQDLAEEQLLENSLELGLAL